MTFNSLTHQNSALDNPSLRYIYANGIKVDRLLTVEIVDADAEFVLAAVNGFADPLVVFAVKSHVSIGRFVPIQRENAFVRHRIVVYRKRLTPSIRINNNNHLLDLTHTHGSFDFFFYFFFVTIY